MHKIVCDLETTGLDPIRNDIVEICLLVINKNDKVIDKFLSKVKPALINEITWTEKAQSVHGFTLKEASKFPKRRDVLIQMLHFLNPYRSEKNLPFICHASPDKFFDEAQSSWSWPHIDYHFLEWAYRKENLQYSFWKVFTCDGIISTISLARKYSGKRFGHKLNVWCEKLNIPLDHHSAESDALACLELYKYFTERLCISSETTSKKESILLEREFKLETQSL